MAVASAAGGLLGFAGSDAKATDNALESMYPALLNALSLNL